MQAGNQQSGAVFIASAMGGKRREGDGVVSRFTDPLSAVQHAADMAERHGKPYAIVRVAGAKHLLNVIPHEMASPVMVIEVCTP